MICIFASGKRKTLFSGKHRKENLFSGPCDDPPPVREGKIVSMREKKSMESGLTGQKLKFCATMVKHFLPDV